MAGGKRVELTVQTVESESELFGTRSEWEGLLQRSPSANVFSSFEWMESCWAFRPPGTRPFLLKLYAGGTLVGLVALRRRGGRGGPMVLEPIGLGGGWWADYLDPLCASGYEEGVLRSALACLEQRRDWDLFDWPELPSESPTAKCFGRVASGKVVQAASSPCYTVELPASWPEYLQRLSGNTRSTLERKTRKLERELGAFAPVGSSGELGETIAAMRSLQDRRWSPGQRAEREHYFRFVADLAPRLHGRGWLDLWALRAEGRLVSSILSFRFRQTVSFYLLAFDPDPRWSRYSVGLLAVAHALRQAIAERFRVFDLLRGDDAYKLRFAAHRRLNRRLQLARKWPWQLYLEGRAALGRLKAAASGDRREEESAEEREAAGG